MCLGEREIASRVSLGDGTLKGKEKPFVLPEKPFSWCAANCSIFYHSRLTDEDRKHKTTSSSLF